MKSLCGDHRDLYQSVLWLSASSQRSWTCPQSQPIWIHGWLMICNEKLSFCPQTSLHWFFLGFGTTEVPKASEQNPEGEVVGPRVCVCVSPCFSLGASASEWLYSSRKGSSPIRPGVQNWRRSGWCGRKVVKERGWQQSPKKQCPLELFSKFTWVGSGHYMIDSMRTVGSEALGKGLLKTE